MLGLKLIHVSKMEPLMGEYLFDYVVQIDASYLGTLSSPLRQDVTYIMSPLSGRDITIYHDLMR